MALNMKMVGCCTIVDPGFDYLAAGFGLQSDNYISYYRELRKGLKIGRTRSFGADYYEEERESTLSEWNIVLPEVDATDSPGKNNIFGTATYMVGRAIDSGSVDCIGLVMAGVSGEDLAPASGYTAPVSSYDGGWTYNDSTQTYDSPGSTDYPMLLYVVDCGGDSGGTVDYTFDISDLLMVSQRNITWTDNGSTTAAERTEAEFSGDSLTGLVGYIAPNPYKKYATRFYGDELQTLVGPSISGFNSNVGVQMVTVDLTTGTIAYQTSTKDRTDAQDIDSTAWEESGPSGSLYYINDAVEQFTKDGVTSLGFTFETAGTLKAWYRGFVGAVGATGDIVYGFTPYAYHTKESDTDAVWAKYFYQEPKPILLCRSTPDKAISLQFTSLSATVSYPPRTCTFYQSEADAIAETGGQTLYLGPSGPLQYDTHPQGYNAIIGEMEYAYPDTVGVKMAVGAVATNLVTETTVLANETGSTVLDEVDENYDNPKYWFIPPTLGGSNPYSTDATLGYKYDDARNEVSLPKPIDYDERGSLSVIIAQQSTFTVRVEVDYDYYKARWWRALGITSSTAYSGPFNLQKGGSGTEWYYNGPGNEPALYGPDALSDPRNYNDEPEDLDSTYPGNDIIGSHDPGVRFKFDFSVNNLDRYETWFINGTEVEMDRLAYVMENGNSFALLHAEAVFVAPGAEGFFVAGTQYRLSINRDYDGTPANPFDTLTALPSPEPHADIRQYVAYYIPDEDDIPIPQYIRIMEGRDLQMSLDAVYSTDGYIFRAHTGEVLGNPGSHTGGLEGYTLDPDIPPTPYVESDYETRLWITYDPGTPDEEVVRSSIIESGDRFPEEWNWTLINFNEDGEYLAEATAEPFSAGAGFVSPNLYANWGVVPGRDGLGLSLPTSKEIPNPPYNDSLNDSDRLPMYTEEALLLDTNQASSLHAEDLTLNWPSTQDGDMAVIYTCAREEVRPAVGDGWQRYQQSSTTTTPIIYCYYRRCDGTESGSINFTYHEAIKDYNVVASITIIRNVDQLQKQEFLNSSVPYRVHLAGSVTTRGVTTGSWTVPDEYTLLMDQVSLAGEEGKDFHFALTACVLRGSNMTDFTPLDYSISTNIRTNNIFTIPYLTSFVFGPEATGALS